MIRRFLATLAAWRWWKQNHTERQYTLMSQQNARGLIWIVFETGTDRVNYCVDPGSPELHLPLVELMMKARDRLKAARAAEASSQ